MKEFFPGRRLSCAALVSAIVSAATPALAADAVPVAFMDLVTKAADFNGKSVTTTCMVALPDDTMGSMCTEKGSGKNVMIDAKSWTAETKDLIMGKCNFMAGGEGLCIVDVTGVVDSSGSGTPKLKNAAATFKSFNK